MFEEISKEVSDETKEIIERAPEGHRQDLKVGLDTIFEELKQRMNRVGVRVILGRRMMEAGDLTIAEKLEKIVDEIKGIKKANEMIRDKVRASDKDLERKDSVPNKRKRAQPAPSI